MRWRLQLHHAGVSGPKRRESENRRGNKGLAQFVERRGLAGAGYNNIPSRASHQELQGYADKHHTYMHTTADGLPGSSRLDRWYIDSTSRKLARGVTTEEAPCNSDHKGVLLEIHSPKGAIRVKKRSKVYPPPNYVKEAMTSLVRRKLEDLRTQLEQAEEGHILGLWDEFKSDIRQQMMQLKQQARRRTTGGYRQTIKRLKRWLEKAMTGLQMEQEAGRHFSAAKAGARGDTNGET